MTERQKLAVERVSRAKTVGWTLVYGYGENPLWQQDRAIVADLYLAANPPEPHKPSSLDEAEGCAGAGLPCKAILLVIEHLRRGVKP